MHLARAGALRAPLARGPPATQLPRQIPAAPQWSRSFSLTSRWVLPLTIFRLGRPRPSMVTVMAARQEPAWGPESANALVAEYAGLY